MNFSNFKKSIFCQLTSSFILLAFCFTSIVPPSYAQTVSTGVLSLPVPGTLVAPSIAYQPTIIKGITIHPDDPLQMNFIIDSGDEAHSDEAFRAESDRLIKYFLASLTVPENELWVNLSPYEENRMVSEGFGSTQMGRDLLAQDYMLKQLTSSMMYPEDAVGQKFWDRVHKMAYQKFGTTDIPMNTFNKIWIVPEKAVIYEHNNNAVIVESRLKVMLEEDYLALENHQAEVKHGQKVEDADVITGASLDVVREVLIPEIEKEINHGQTFAQLRQIYHAVILSDWYKQNLRESFLGQAYVDQNRTGGIESEDKEINQKIYNQYLESFKKGVYDYIREDVDPMTNRTVPRRYFSGGADFAQLTAETVESENILTPRQLASIQGNSREVTVDFAMTGDPKDVSDALKRPRRMVGSEAGIREGSSAQIYGDRVVQANWYQANLAFDLDPVVERISDTGQDVVLDASAGTGGASIYLLEQLRATGKKIKKLVLTDVEYGQSIGYMKYAQRKILNQYDDVVEEVEFYILPKLGQDEAGVDEFALVSDIPGLKADHIIMENAIHLIPKSQLVRTLKGYRDVMANNQVVLTMGSGDVQVPAFPEDHVGIHDLFDLVSEEVAFLMNNDVRFEDLRDMYNARLADETIQARKLSAFPASNTLEDIQVALAEAGFATPRTSYNRDLELEQEDYKPFITDISGYVQSRIVPELARVDRESDPYSAMRRVVVDRAYNNVYEKNPAGFRLFWTRMDVLAAKADSAMTVDVQNIGDKKFKVSYQGNEVAFGTWENDYYAVMKPIGDKDLDQDTAFRNQYYASILAFAHQHVQETGRMITLRESVAPNRMNAFLQGEVHEYAPAQDFRGIEAGFQLGEFEGTRYSTGDPSKLRRRERPYKIKYKLPGDQRASVITFKDGTGSNLRVVPETAILGWGAGTINSKIMFELNRLGYDIIVANRSPNERAKGAIQRGYKVIPLNKDGLGAYKRAGLPIYKDAAGKEVTAESYLDGAEGLERISGIVEGLDGKMNVVVDADGDPVMRDGKVLRDLPDNWEDDGLKMGSATISQITKLETWDNYDYFVIYQGSNDPDKVADGNMSDTGAFAYAGINFQPWMAQQNIMCGSCNTTSNVALLLPILASVKESVKEGSMAVDLDPSPVQVKPGSLEVDVLTIRRAADPGSPKNAIDADGFADTAFDYHHAEDAMAFFKQQLENGDMLAAFRRVKGEASYVTDATVGPQTKFHVGRAVISAEKVVSADLANDEDTIVTYDQDGNASYSQRLTADDLKLMLDKHPRVAVVDTGKKFSPTKIFSTLMNDIQRLQAFVMPVMIRERKDGKIVAFFLTPQESNVIPNNVSTVLLRTGVVAPDDVAYAVEEVDKNVGVDDIIRGLKEFNPDATLAEIIARDAAMAADEMNKALRSANLAKKVGLIPHRDDDSEEDRFFSVNRWIKAAYDADQTQTIDRVDSIINLSTDQRIEQSLLDNDIDPDELREFIKEVEFVGVQDMKNGSPTLVIRNANEYQVAHAGVTASRVYVGQGIADELGREDESLLDLLLLREAAGLFKAKSLMNDDGSNYNAAVAAGEDVANQVEAAIDKEKLNEFVQASVDAFLERYYQQLLKKNVIWDYESSVLDEKRGKELVGGKTYQQGLYWSQAPSKNLRSFGASTTASTKFLKAYKDLIPQINAILDDLDVSDEDGRRGAEASIRKLITSYDVPADIERDLREAYRELRRITKQDLVAIRSSGKAEDNAYIFKVLTDVNIGSNAGQHDSYLGESGEDAVVRRWRDDVASLYTEQVLKYRDTLMVIQAFDEILSDAEKSEEIIETLSQSSDANDQLVAEALADKNFNIVTSIKLRKALSKHGYDDQVEIVNKHRQSLLDVENIAMGVTVMPMAGVDISFVIMGHDISADWTAMGFQDIPEDEYVNRGRVATITTNYGIGESIVQGVATPDTFLVHIFEDENGSHVNILSRQLGTKTVQAVYTAPVLEKLGLIESEVEVYLNVLEGSNVLPSVGLANGVDVKDVRNVLQRLIALTVDKTVNEITDEDLQFFAYDKDDLKLLVHLLKELEEDPEMKTMFTDVSENMRNSFSATDSQVIEIAKEFMEKARGYGHLVDMEGAVGLNLGKENTPVTVQRRPSNVDGDVKKPDLIEIDYTYVPEKDLKEVRSLEEPMPNVKGEDSGLIRGELVAQGIATRNSFSGQIFKISEEKSLPSQFEEIKRLADSGVQVIIRTRETTPDYNAVLQTKNVMGVIADVGGATSHAAVMSRELGIATVVGIQSWVNKLEASVGEEKAQQILEYINTSGNVVTVDANANESTGFGAVYAGELPISKRYIEIDLKRLPEVYTRIGYIMGMPHPMLAMSKISRYSGYSGVALMRGEFAYAEENINPRFGRAYDNFLVDAYLRTVKDNPPARRYRATLNEQELEALDKFRMHLKAREDARARGIDVVLDETNLKIQEFINKGHQAFLASLDENSRRDIDLIRQHPEQISLATKQMMGYVSYNEFFEAVHGGAIATMAAANNVKNNAVLYRSIDFKKNEARELIGSEVFDPTPEVSTMIGERGARWLLQPENQIILREEIRMILRQVVKGYANIGFFFPFVSTPDELDELMRILVEEERAMSEQLQRPVYLREVGQMTELPSNVIQGDQFIKVLKDHEADQKAWFQEQFGVEISRKSFLSFGTNDLTQLTLGADRDNPDMSYLFSEAHPFVIESIRHVVNIAKELETKCGLCGQALVNLVNINPEAAETILMMLGQTGGYAGTDYLGTLASITRAASATLKHGVVDSPVASTNEAGEFAVSNRFDSQTEKGAATRPAYMVKRMSELEKSYVGDFVVLTGNLDFKVIEELDENSKATGRLLVEDESLREQFARLGAVIVARIENFSGQEDQIKAIRQLGVPIVETSVKVTGALNRELEDGDMLTIDFNNKTIYREVQDVRVDVPGLQSEIQLSETESPTESIEFDAKFRASEFYLGNNVHPLRFIETTDGEAKLRQSLKADLLLQLKDKKTRLVYETLDLQSDDLFKLKGSKKYMEEPEVNPALGFAGLDALVKDPRWERLLRIELEVLAELIEDGYRVYIQFNSVKVPESIGKALEMVEAAGIEIDSQVGMNTAWPGNYLALDQYLAQGLSFITLDERRLAQGYLSADLFKNQSVIDFYTAEKVLPNLRRPIAMITRAAADQNVAVQRVAFNDALTVDQAMVAMQALDADDEFLDLLERARAEKGQGYAGDINGKSYWLDDGFLQANSDKLISKIAEALQLLMSRNQLDADLSDGFAPAVLAEIGYSEEFIDLIAAVGRKLGLWKIYPDDIESEEFTRITYQADPSHINYPYLEDVDVQRLGLDNAMISSDKDVGGIDLDPNLFEIERKGEGSLIFPKYRGNPDNIRIQGIVPVIINVTPITNLPMILGLKDAAEDESKTISYDSLDPSDRKVRFQSEDRDQLSLVRG